MRLLHTDHLTLQEWTSSIPRYAILSHTWEDEEVSYTAIQDLATARNLKGYAKVRNAARMARSLGYDWIWIDTCNIDKSSSAELSETINSMFKYYKNAGICIAYLADVVDVFDDLEVRFKASRWFTRGWTLQELIAPQNMQFYAQDWRCLGTKLELSQLIHESCEIDAYVLRGNPLSRISLARRMFWASKRRTSREEDMAYCLLGIFEIHMPLLYGEGLRNAFRRLQREILKVSDDQSLFAWTNNFSDGSLLAASPQDFANSRELGAFTHRSINNATNFAVQTESGLQMRLITAGTSIAGDRVAILNCQLGHQPGSYPLIALDSDVRRGRWSFARIQFANLGQRPDMLGATSGSLRNRMAVLMDDSKPKKIFDLQYALVNLESLPHSEPLDRPISRFWIARTDDACEIEFVGAREPHMFDAATNMLYFFGREWVTFTHIDLRVHSKNFIFVFRYHLPRSGPCIRHYSIGGDRLLTLKPDPRTISDSFMDLDEMNLLWEEMVHKADPEDQVIDIEQIADSLGIFWKISAI